MSKQLKIELTGLAPLMMHSERLVDPTNEHTKRIAALAKKAKASKTLEAYEQLKRAEWEGGLYLNAEGAPCIPASNILACLTDGAKKSKLGKQAKSGVFCDTPDFELSYDGPSDLDELFAAGFSDYRGCKVTTSRVMRCRPLFKEWSVIIELTYVPEVISREQILTAMETAGLMCGLGDYRPQHGRFKIKLIKG